MTESSHTSPARKNASASSTEDHKLVIAAKRGNENAFNRIVKKYERALYFHVLKMIKDKNQVDDLVQEAFTKAFESLDRYSSSYAFSTWLYRITTNHTIDYLRKKKLQTVSINEPVDTGEGEMKFQLPDAKAKADRSIIRKQRQNIVRNAIEELPKKYRSVINLRHIQEKTYREIADELVIPLGTVKAHIFRAREMLYRALKDKREQF